MAPSHSPPLSARVEPTTRAEVAAVVRECFESATPVYSLGGETSLGFGLPAKLEGLGLSTKGLSQLVDFPVRDLTITVESGMTVGGLAKLTAKEGLQLTVDAPFAQKATIGGLIATGWNGPRRYGYGRVRDQVIGIRAIDGVGAEFKGGGRVVKNVAGYDFCKLLTGSMGTLGVITEATLKLKPLAEDRVWLVIALAELDEVDRKLEELVHFPAIPTSICVLHGSDWKTNELLANFTQPNSVFFLAVGLEGSSLDVQWSLNELARILSTKSVPTLTLRDEYDQLLSDLTHFAVDGHTSTGLAAKPDAALVLRAAVVPSGVTAFINAVLTLDPTANLLSHAGSGVVDVKLAEIPSVGIAKVLIGNLHEIVRRHHGNITILSNPSASEMTHQATFGGDAAWKQMREVKRQFDPKNLLNPGRMFV